MRNKCGKHIGREGADRYIQIAPLNNLVSLGRWAGALAWSNGAAVGADTIAHLIGEIKLLRGMLLF